MAILALGRTVRSSLQIAAIICVPNAIFPTLPRLPPLNPTPFRPKNALPHLPPTSLTWGLQFTAIRACA
jgi:hypothetical protein